jgi:hypothetical protein
LEVGNGVFGTAVPRPTILTHEKRKAAALETEKKIWERLDAAMEAKMEASEQAARPVVKRSRRTYSPTFASDVDGKVKEMPVFDSEGKRVTVYSETQELYMRDWKHAHEEEEGVWEGEESFPLQIKIEPTTE